MTALRANEPTYKIKRQQTWQVAHPTMVLRYLSTSMEK
jgi:hypothetical protein